MARSIRSYSIESCRFLRDRMPGFGFTGGFRCDLHQACGAFKACSFMLDVGGDPFVVIFEGCGHDVDLR